MKIGILTYHRTLNYGACLQALATRIVLEKLGHEVFYVDYWPRYHSQGYKAFSFKKFLKLPSVGWKLRYIHSIGQRKKRNDSFESFQKKYIIPYCKPDTEEYDIVLYGSDQIWRKQKSINGYDPVYFANNCLNAKKHVAFSASMGVLPNNDVDRNEIKSLLAKFDKISVREKDLLDLVKSFGYSSVILTLDPTLLLDSNDWDKTIPTSTYTGNPYVLVYCIGNADAFNLESIRRYAVDRKLKVIILSGTPGMSYSNEYVTTASPFEFLGLIKNADTVFTSSFHGLVFSILYHKEVYASFSHNSNRAKTLLDTLGLSDRLLQPSITIPNLKGIDYHYVEMMLKRQKESTLNFLINQ